MLSAASLIPLAWLIGETTEHAAEHTGPGVGGFLNASFGNAPELIIALFAVGDGLPQVVRGSLAGSVISNLLLVFGVTQVVGPEKEIDRRSLLAQLGLVGVAVAALRRAVGRSGYTGAPERHAAVLVSIPISVALLVLYLAVTGRNLHRHRRLDAQRAVRRARGRCRSRSACSPSRPVATAIVSEILVHSIDALRARGRRERVLHRRGDRRDRRQRRRARRRDRHRPRREDEARERDRDLVERAGRRCSSSRSVMLLSLFFTHQLPLSFRWEELVAMAGAVVLAGATIWDGRTKRWEGVLLIVAYAVVVVGLPRRRQPLVWDVGVRQPTDAVG